jgi:nucleoside-diphosphate-sugar epimerase
MQSILVSGAKGVIGTLLWQALAGSGWRVQPFDIAFAHGTAGHGDIRERPTLDSAVLDCEGIIHLAAVSRVISGERDPDACQTVNVDGTRILVEAAAASARRPWIIFMSSCQVYGSAPRLPVVESDPIAPVNNYGRSKAAAEDLLAKARAKGLETVTFRLPNVYGSVRDYPDRAVPAFVQGALRGDPLHVTGASQVFDFLHVSDVGRGIVRAAQLLASGTRDLPTMNLATGRATTLGELASLAKELAASDSPVVEDQPRQFDTLGYVGDSKRAREVLGWSAEVPLEVGMSRLISELSRSATHANQINPTMAAALQLG